MAVERVSATSRLQLRLQTGVDSEGRPVFRSRSYANIKAAAADADLYEVAEALAQLQEHVLQDVYRHDAVTLVPAAL